MKYHQLVLHYRFFSPLSLVFCVILIDVFLLDFFVVFLVLIYSVDTDKYVSCLSLFPSTQALEDSRKMGKVDPYYCAVTAGNT